jgi:hypothetical protein
MAMAQMRLQAQLVDVMKLLTDPKGGNGASVQFHRARL